MTSELLEIQANELKFTFELKKQSSCSVKLHNKSDQFVAFKVKTTSPKKYCVRPNIGIVKPSSTCDFTVTMQAQRTAPTDMECKDKFLIQSTIVPFGTIEEDITSNMFTKVSGKHIEEKKLKVVLITPSPSPVLLPINKESKQDLSYETSVQKDKLPSGAENIPPPHRDSKDVERIETTEGFEKSGAAKDAEPRPTINDVQEQKPARDVVFLNLTKEFEELTLKLNKSDSKLKEAELTIMKLKEQISTYAREKDTLEHELEILRKSNVRRVQEILRKSNVRRVQVGFPPLYVCMVALICLTIGYLVHR